MADPFSQYAVRKGPFGFAVAHQPELQRLPLVCRLCHAGVRLNNRCNELLDHDWGHLNNGLSGTGRHHLRRENSRQNHLVSRRRSFHRMNGSTSSLRLLPSDLYSAEL